MSNLTNCLLESYQTYRWVIVGKTVNIYTKEVRFLYFYGGNQKNSHNFGEISQKAMLYRDEKNARKRLGYLPHDYNYGWTYIQWQVYLSYIGTQTRKRIVSLSENIEAYL